jgi:hypothetical protein
MTDEEAQGMTKKKATSYGDLVGFYAGVAVD